MGCVVYNLKEKICSNSKYELSVKSKNVIDSVLDDYNIGKSKVLTHPKYTKETDPQNRALYDYLTSKELSNHFVFSITQSKHSLPTIQKKALMKYSMIFKEDDTKHKQFIKYAEIAETIGNLE